MSDETKIDDGGPAFPCEIEEDADIIERKPGMSLRDYFAAKVMPQVLFSATTGDEGSVSMMSYPTSDKWRKEADLAYAIADAMIAARKS